MNSATQDLELVVLSFASPSPTQVDELMTAATDGSVSEADMRCI